MRRCCPSTCRQHEDASPAQRAMRDSWATRCEQEVRLGDAVGVRRLLGPVKAFLSAGAVPQWCAGVVRRAPSDVM